MLANRGKKMEFYKIADIIIRIDMPHFDYIQNKMSKYRLGYVPKSWDSEITVYYNTEIDVSGIEPFAKDKGGRCYFQDGGTLGFYDYIDITDKVYTLLRTDAERKNIVFYYNDLSDVFDIPSDSGICGALGEIFKEILIHNGGLVVHASAIEYENSAVTFTAPSGTGKSTHTALWKEFYPQTVVINDDAPAIRAKDGCFYAYGTPWSGKTDINENVCVPLRAMVFLERSEEPSIRKIGVPEAFVRTVSEIPMFVFKETSDKMMSVLNEIFSNVPTYLLKCDISKKAVDTVKNILFNGGDKNEEN